MAIGLVAPHYPDTLITLLEIRTYGYDLVHPHHKASMPVDYQAVAIAHQAAQILPAIKRLGYNYRKLIDQPAWEITGIGDNNAHFVLMYMPRPVTSWTLLPHGNSKAHQAIYRVIDQALRVQA
ncbi:MAG: hypothetical protein HC878_03560 [Leptolyngbyaceae cyanobacterium SL_5_14]|nr:hypothetical protein [Leptolyngbyaceae cyanobacterium SL_5_14]NJO66160.1 hypothetical protein [Leptolyngbyaceae cyanobacterium RM1_405_57]